MGAYLIPNARSIVEAVVFVGESPLSRSWEQVPEGIIVSDAVATDDELATAYAAFVPSGATDDEFVQPLPAAVLGAGRIVRRLALATDAELAAMTQADVRQSLRAIGRAIIYLNRRLDVE